MTDGFQPPKSESYQSFYLINKYSINVRLQYPLQGVRLIMLKPPKMEKNYADPNYLLTFLLTYSMEQSLS